jgi:hypothetical protein
MIDLWGVLANVLWIVGLAVVLAAFSLVRYRALREGRRLRLALGQRAFRLALAAGMLLFSLGLLATDGRLWARLLWGALAGLWVWQGWVARRQTTATADRLPDP